MTLVFGALAQTVPAAVTLTDAYTCPASKRATVEVVVCNRGADASVRLTHAIAGGADAPAQYLLFDHAVLGGETRSTERITVAAGDVLRVYSTTGAVAFNINGVEEDV